jgi:hypothetical protein
MRLCRLILLFSGLVIGLAMAVLPLAAQPEPVPLERSLPENAVPGLNEESLPDARTDLQAGGEPEFPNKEVLRNPEKSYDTVFYSSSSGGRVGPKVDGPRLTFPSDLLQGGLKYNLPFRTASNTTNAEIRLGRFYIDLLSVSTSFLYSDNVNRTEFNAHGGFIGIAEFDILGIFQITDNLRLAFKTGLIWLPLKNQFGVAGFTRDSFSGRVFYGSDPYQLTQFTYDLSLGGWEMRFYDHLRALQTLYADQFYLLTGGDSFDEEDRTGRYVFRSRLGAGAANGISINETGKRNTESFIEVRNTVGASISRLLPTVTRLEVGAFHSDMFYYGANADTLPHSRDVAYASLNSERESLRFQPFLSYRVYRNDERQWNHEIRGGVTAPLTQNLHLLGSAGYMWHEESKSERVVGNLRLRQTLGTYTMHQVEYLRDLTYPEQDLENSVSYRLRQTLGPYLYGVAFVKYATFEDLDRNGSGTDEWRTGVHFNLSPSSRTTIRVGGLFSRINYDYLTLGSADKWTAVGQIRHRFSDSWETVFTYQYQTLDSTVAGNSYAENLFILTVNYYFGQRERSSYNRYDPASVLGR